MPLVDPLTLLEREDKWYLGSGGMLIYAPPFPQHLRTPGFWDECHFGDLSVPRLLCVSVAVELDGALIELEPHMSHWRWFPDHVEARHYLVRRDGVGYKQQVGQRLWLNETRRVGLDGTLCCDVAVEPQQGTPRCIVHVVAWTVRQRGSGERADAHRDFAWDGTALSYTQAVASRAHARGAAPLELHVAMTADHAPTSVEVTPSHSAHLGPRLAFTPLWDSLKRGRLSGEVRGENVLGSVVYAGMHWRCEMTPRGKTQPKPFTLKLAVTVRDPKSGSRPVPGAGVHQDAPTPDPQKAWREFLSLVPHFECDDEMLTRYYWYRWYGLRLNAVPPGGNYTAPAVTEGIAYFRGVITYSLMCHLRECKWLADPSLAQGCLRNHIAHQTRAGHFPGHIYVGHVNDDGFYHTDVGGAVDELLLAHPDDSFRREIHAPLKRLLAYYTRERDTEGLDLFDLRDQFETGQEFTSRYFHADKRADLYGWEHKLKLKGVDVTSYVYMLARYLQHSARALGDTRAVREYAELAERIKAAVREIMWDAERGFFFDYSVQSKRRSPYWSAVGFYPALSDLATPAQAAALGRHLLPGGRFATPWPTPTVPPDDLHFAADPRWRGERANCPWNGRVWPMVNSHIADVLGTLAGLDPAIYRPALATYLRRFIEMMHFEQHGAAGRPKDFSRPNCFEHYSPLDGSACEYRGIDDYMHSWVADLILKYVAGVRLYGEPDGRAVLRVDPLPFGLQRLLLANCTVHGHRLDVCLGVNRRGQSAEGYRVFLDGRLVFRAKQPAAWEASL